LVIYSNVAVRGSTNHQFLLAILADYYVGTLQVVWREYFELQLIRDVTIAASLRVIRCVLSDQQ
jgi:hypothetical protein